jgi:hypothetical protein
MASNKNEFGPGGIYLGRGGALERRKHRDLDDYVNCPKWQSDESGTSRDESGTARDESATTWDESAVDFADTRSMTMARRVATARCNTAPAL